MPLPKDTKIGNEGGSAYQEAVEYGIDVRQLEHLLTLTPAERLRRLNNNRNRAVGYPGTHGKCERQVAQT